MKIYISHSKKFDFRTDLYMPILSSELVKDHQFVLPHEHSDTAYSTKELFHEKGCDLVIAEVSFPSTGQGIELGWADYLNIPVVCLYKQGTEISNSLSAVSHKFLMYADNANMISDIEGLLKEYE